MTATVDAPPVTAPVTQPPVPLPPPRARPVATGLSAGAQVAVSLGILGALVLGFVGYLYGLSGLGEQHAQDTMRASFAAALGKATAPIGPDAQGNPIPEGTPVAALTIPRLGLQQTIVVEGTSARDTAAGPGHRRDTVLPGQAGVSAIYGRRMTFGAPFARLLSLQVGDVITVVTGQGVAKYRVSSFGDSAHPAPANSANRLVLASADAGAVPHQIVTVSADLITKPFPDSAVVAGVPADESELAGDPGPTLLPLLLWSQALLLLAVAVPFLATRWSPVATYLCVAPIALGVLWNLYENLALLLPNMY